MSQAASGSSELLNGCVEQLQLALNSFAHNSDLAASLKISFPDLSIQQHVNDDVIFPAASLLKIPIAIAIEKMNLLNALDSSPTFLVSDLLKYPHQNSVLSAFNASRVFSLRELLSLMLICSDEPSTHALRSVVSTKDINSVLLESKFLNTKLNEPSDRISVSGTTTAKEAMLLLELATNSELYPQTSSSLENSVLNSRIPLGVDPTSFRLAHKTGSLFGVAHDVARLKTPRGNVFLAFLSQNQSDTVMTGLNMGLTVQRIMKVLDTQTVSSLSVIKDLDV